MPSAQPDPKVLLERTERLRALAFMLLAGDDGAEDVAQEALLSSLGRSDGREALPEWLPGVARSLASRLRRSRARRALHEAAAARPEALPSASELVERAWLHRTLVEAVVALDEPYRSSILLRYFEGLPPREIARRLGEPVETVKTRIQRALAQLRARLQGRLGPESLAALAGVSGIRSLEKLARIRPSGTQLPVPIALKGVFVATQLKPIVIASVVVLAGIGVFLATRGSPPAVAMPGPSSSAALDIPAPLSESPHSTPVDSTPSIPAGALRSTAVVSVASESATSNDAIDRNTDLFGDVVDSDGHPVQGAKISASLMEERPTGFLVLEQREPRPAAVTESDVDGRFRLRLAPGRRYQLDATHPLFAAAQLPERYAGERVRVVLETAGFVHGRVTRSPSSEASADSRVVLRRTLESRNYMSRMQGKKFETTTDVNGSWSMTGLPAGVYDVRVKPLLSPVFLSTPLSVTAGATIACNISLPASELVRGLVTDRQTGLPIAGAEVGHSWAFNGAATTVFDGSFEIRVGFQNHSYADTLTARAPGYARSEQTLNPGDPVHLDLKFELDPELVVLGRIVDPRGMPLADALVEAFGQADTSVVPEAEPEFLGVDHAVTRSAADGRFQLAGLSRSARHSLCARMAGFGSALVDLPDQEVRAALVELGDVQLFEAATIRGRVMDTQGRPVTDIDVHIDGDPAGRHNASLAASPSVGNYTTARQVRVDDLGRFACTDLSPGTYRVNPIFTGFIQPAVVEVHLQAGDSQAVELRVDRGLSIAGQVVGFDGRRVSNAFVRASLTSDHFAGTSNTHTQRDGTFELTGLVSGVYTFEVTLWPRSGPGDDLCELRFEGIAAGSAGVHLELPKRASIRGRILAPDGKPPINAVVQIDHSSSWFGGLLTSVSNPLGEFELGVPAGSTVDLLAFDFGGPGRAIVRVVQAGTEGLEIRLRE